jgi:hypothetical protein
MNWKPAPGITVGEVDDRVTIATDSDNDPWTRELQFSSYSNTTYGGRELVNIKVHLNPRTTKAEDRRVHAGVSVGREELLAIQDFISRVLRTSSTEQQFNELQDRLRREQERT